MNEPRGVRARWPGLVLGLLLALLVKDLGLKMLLSYWGSFSPLVPLSGLVGLMVWRTRVARVLVALTVVTMTLWLVVAFTPITRLLVRPLLRRDAVTQADAIYVLCANVQPDDEPSSASMARALRGLELLGQHLAPRLLVAELPPPYGSYLRWMRSDAKLLGLDAASIESVGLIDNTHDEAMRVAAALRAKGLTRLLLVSSPTHMRRAAAVFERAGVPVVIAVPAMETEVDLERLAHSDERIFVFRLVAHEWLGLLSYRLRGWI